MANVRAYTGLVLDGFQHSLVVVGFAGALVILTPVITAYLPVGDIPIVIRGVDR